MAKTVQEALEERKKRLSLNPTKDKVSAALEARKKRLESEKSAAFKSKPSPVTQDDYADRYNSWVSELQSPSYSAYNPRTWHDSSYYKNYASTTSELINEGNSLAEYFKTDEKYKDVYDSITKNLTSLNDFSSNITEASDFYGKYATYEDYSKARDDYNAYQETLKFDTDAATKQIEELEALLKQAKGIKAKNQQEKIRSHREKNYSKSKELKDNKYNIDEFNALLKENGYSSLSEIEKAKADLTDKTRNAKNVQALDSYYNTAMKDDRFAELSESGKGIKDDAIVKDYDFQEYYEGDYQTQFGDKSVNKTDSEEINPLSKTLASYLNNEEYDLYTYYLALDKENGTNEAEKLYEAIKPTLEARQSGEAAEYYDDDWLSQSGFAFKAGLEGWATDLGTFITAPFRDDEYIAPTVVQQTSAQLRENLANDGSMKLPDWLGGGSLSQVSYDIFNTTGRMLPSVLISRGVGTFAPDAVGKLAFGVSMGTSSAGSGYAEMINLGYSKGQALSYGVMVGAAETAMSTLLGSIGGKVGGDGLFAKLSEKALIKIDNAIARVAVTMALDAASEGVEEALQTAIEPWLKSVATGVDFEAANIDEILYSGLLGAISAFVMEGPGIVGQESLAAQTGGLIKNSEGGIEKIKKLGQGFSADSVAYKIASRVNENTPASKIGRLFQEIGATITEQNVNDISAALEATGMDAPTARRNAKSYAQYINKEVKLTPTGLAMLDSNSPLADAVRSVLIDSNTTPYQRTEEFLRLNAIANGESVPNNTPVVDKSTTKEATEALSNEFSSAPSYSPTANKILSQKGYKPIERDNNKDSVTLNDGTNAKILDVVTKDGKIKLRVETSKGVKSVNPNSVNFASENTKALIERVGGLGLDSVSAWSIIKEYKGGDPNLYFNDAYNAYTSGRMGINPSEVETFAINPDVKARLYNTGRAAGKVFSKGAQKNINNKLNNQKNAATRKGSIVFESNATPKTEIQKKSVAALEKVAKALGITFHLYESTKNGKSFSYKMPDGTLMSASGFYKQANGEIWVDLNAGNKGDGLILYTAAHELTHFIKQWSPEKYKIFADFLLEQYGEKGVSVNALIDRQIAKAERNNRTLSREAALEEVVADSCESFLTDSDALEKVAVLKERDKSLVEKIRSFIADLLHKIRSIYSSFAPDSTEGRLVRDMTDALEKLHSLWTDALTDASRSFIQLGVSEVDSSSESVSPVLSERTWTESEYVTAREEAAERLSDALGVSKKKALAYIDNVNSIAKMIADNRTRLDYEASPFGSAFVSNTEYGGSFDFTTLCKKRRLYTGTFSEIQKRLRNTALTPDDILTIRNMMIDKGLEATCGLCYVEGSRANMGKFAKEFIRLYKRDNPNAWIPDMADVNTPDGVESMKINHPEAYEQYEYFWNHYGKLKDSDPALFASQQKPKLYEARKEYKGEILKAFKNDSAVEKKNLNGGIRMQSFSDFEIVHLIDTMQIIMDMSTVGLAGQAYTKVPEFAEAFGNTGLKINLSLIAKGVDENGNLIFDDREGMPHKTAFGLRDKYSKNVGTIIVTFTDEQLLAAMADPRIDFIIPFHRSQWKKGQYGAMGLPKGTKDYTFMQNEKLIKQTYHEYRGRMVKDKASNYMPNEYWDFSKSGKENAEAYLKMCAENNKRPKFYKLLDYDGKGTYSLKKDGSTDGYWKLLIDFKMYDNDGIGSPQNAVAPDFSMNEATQILDEYRGGHHNYPVAQEVVDEFVEKYESDDVQYSERYSYDELISKPDIKITTLSGAAPNNRADVVFYAKKNAASIGKIDKNGGVSVYVDDIGTDVFLGTDGLKHGLRRLKKLQSDENTFVTLKAGEILKNSIRINELIPSKENATGSYILIGAAQNTSGDLYIVRSVVNHFKNELTSIDVLYAINAKKELAATKSPRSTAKPLSVTNSTISVAQMLDFVNRYFPDVLPGSVLRHYGHTERPEGELGESALYSDRDPDAITDRELLANVLEASAQTDWEKKKLKEYKAKIAEKEALSRELAEIENNLGKMLKAKGKGSRPRDEIRKLQEDKMNITKKLNIYDNQLLRLESTKALADLATREKNVLKAKMNAKQKAAIKSLKDETANKLKEQRKELMEEKREAISELRSEKNKKIEEIRQEYRESKEKLSRQKRETILRGKIRSLYEDLQKALDAPTDNRYIPAELAQSMIDILGLFDFDTSVIKKDGSVNQAQVRRDEMKLRLQSLKAEYDKLGKDEEESIINEYEEDISDYFGTLADKYGNLKISEIPLEELEDLYDILRSINETLKDARSLLGKSDAETVYKYADEIMAQQNAIIAKRKNHKRSAIQKLSNSLSNMSISTMRNVLRMADFDKDSALYDLFNDLEIGVRNKNFFEMESRKLFEEITKGKNEALYEEALYEPYKGIELTDDKGKKFKVTKMQMMQVILSYEREKANKTTNHVENGGFTFADITKLGKGDLRGAIDKENSHTVTKSGKDLAESFAEKLKNDEWAQKYMEVAKKFFNEKAKDAVNEVMLQTKHRIIAKEKNYIPFVVDSAYIVAEINGNVDVQKTINSYGSLKDLKKGSSQPLIITGLNNIIDRHISDVSSIVGLTVPVRNINKVWNSKSKEKDETVKGNVETAWGESGTKLISQAIADVQSPRKDTQPFIYKKIRSGYIGATFLLNGSVVAKQTGSLLSATSMIRYRDPTTMLANLGRTMAHFSEIAAEVDKYTASAWMRRQGMSDAEVYSLLTDARKSKITKALNKLPAGVNPAKWITAMDSAVALSLWRYCKEDVKELHPELEGEELNRATAAFYDTVIENTQSMTDVLHRPEIQKSKNIISESFGMFKTDLFQMAGALQTAWDTCKAHPTKANLKALAKTSLAVTSSAMWGQLLTILFAMLRYKMKPYKDDEDELTVESFLTRASFGLGSELVGYVLPLFGSDVIKLFENIAYGETQDAVDNLVISSVNNVVNAFMQVAISIKEGEAPDWGQYKKLVTTSLQMFGLPANNILRTVEAITNHAKDIANGEFLSFNADSKQSKAELLYDAYVNNSADYQQLLEDYSSEESATSALKQQFRAKEKRIVQAVIASVKGNVEKRVEIAQDIVSEGMFDKDFVTSSINAEETYLTNKVKDLVKYEEKGDTKKAKEILEELVKRGYDEDFIDWVKENLEDETSGSSSSASSYYKASDLKKLVGKKDSTDTLELIENLLKEKEEYYKSQGENKVNSKNKAKTSVASSLTKYLKPLYLEAWNNKDIAEVRRIKKLMLQSRLYEDVTKTVDGWMVAARKQK